MPREVTGKIQLTPPFFIAIMLRGNPGTMSVKLILLKSGETVISDAKELLYGEEEGKIVGYLLNNPFTISTQKSILLTEEPQFDSKDSTVEITMSPWILLTSDKAVPIKPDWVVTVVEPLESVKQMYEDRLNAFTEQDDQSTPAEG
jgi:hypothetical protein